MFQRQYSFTVVVWKWHEGNKEDVRDATIVATSNEDAMEEARVILDPDEKFDDQHEWAITSAMEMNPKDSKEWARWHREATSPLERREAVEVANAADASLREGEE